MAARRAHNPKVVGSSPTPATTIATKKAPGDFRGLFVFRLWCLFAVIRFVEGDAFFGVKKQMRANLQFWWLIVALAIVALVVACGSDDSLATDTPPNLAVAQKDTEPIDGSKAGSLYREALSRVQLRELETREYIYLSEEIELVEQALEIRPGYPDALEVLSWVYNTYPAYAEDDVAHETALEYAEELFRVRGEADKYSYQLLGAAVYSKDQLELGDRYFDKAIESAPTDVLEQMFRQQKEILREPFATRPLKGLIRGRVFTGHDPRIASVFRDDAGAFDFSALRCSGLGYHCNSQVAVVSIEKAELGNKKISRRPGAGVAVGPGMEVGAGVAVGAGVGVGTIDNRGAQYWLSKAQALLVSNLERSNSCSWA